MNKYNTDKAMLGLETYAEFAQNIVNVIFYIRLRGSPD